MAIIANYPQPSALFRYRPMLADGSTLDRELRAIEEAYVWTGPFSSMNDSMEGMYAASGSLRADAEFESLSELITRAKGSIGIASFSESFDHELMWAHYASQFAGLCVGYSLPQLLRNLDNDCEFVRISYKETAPRLSMRDRRNITGDVARKVLSFKNHRWAYENEWRLFSGRCGRTCYGDTSCVRRVYVGSRISREDLREVDRRMRRLDIPVARMRVTQYAMSFSAPRRAQRG